MRTATGFLAKTKKILKVLGPGLITGASDDDPSGIATYSQAGARFGFNTLWTALITFPLMAGIQEMCARIGLVTTVGLTTTLKRHYPKVILYLMMVFSIPAIILNIGADIAGMGAVANLIFPAIKATVFNIAFTVILFILIVFLPYDKIVAFLKYLCLSMFLYIAVPFFTGPDWMKVFHRTFIPTIKFDKDFIEVLVAILGTTISPYLFFWQVSMEAEDVQQAKSLILARRRLIRQNGDASKPDNREQSFVMKLIKKMQLDVNFGMLLSTLVMFFIILATGTALNPHGIKQIDTVEQAAKALEPVAGKASYFLFALGVIGTGFLAVPVLTGSLSYIVAETFGWKASLDKKYWQAKKFYFVILISLLAGLSINYLGISPIKALFYTAILYGLTCPIIIAIVLHIGNNKKIMKEYTNSKLSNVLGILTLVLMTAAAISLIYFQFA
jgi:NRAMP (natural resistance-associated macrophage protein)-like metal ion transporter